MKAKKVMALALAAVMLICASVAATIAYFTDSESVKNTFTVGQVGISLDEADVNEYGELLYKDAEKTQLKDRVKANEYKLIPGHTYVKDPTVTVDENSEESYVRMWVKITNEDMAKLKAAFPVNKYPTWYNGEVFLLQMLVNGWDNAVWKTQGAPKSVAESGVEYTVYEFRYHTKVSTVGVAAKKLDPLFTSITVPSTTTGTELNNLQDVEIHIEAHAIQAAGFDTADLAWAEF